MSNFIEQDAAAAGPVSSDLLERITTLAKLMVEQQAELAAATAAAEAAKAALDRTETEDLPELMKEIGLLELKLADGSKVEVKPDLHCGISEARRPDAHAWLEEHEFGGLIKTELRLAFDRDERQKAVAAAIRISKLFKGARAVEMVEAVHPATLKAFLKEQLALGAEGSQPPAELFGIMPYDKAKLTPPKAAAPVKRKAK